MACSEEAKEGMEGRVLKALPVPRAPSAQEIAEHRVSHWPFRSWCDFCVQGRGHERGHSSTATGEAHDFPLIAADYGYVGRGVRGDDGQLRKPGGQPMLVIVDSSTKRLFAHQVPAKGRDGMAIKRIVRDLKDLGHPTIVMKADQENPIQAMMESVGREWSVETGGRVVYEEPPAYDSKSN